MVCQKCNGTHFSAPLKDRVTHEYITKCSSCGNGVVVDSAAPIADEPKHVATTAYPRTLWHFAVPSSSRSVNNSEDEALARGAGFTLDAAFVPK